MKRAEARFDLVDPKTIEAFNVLKDFVDKARHPNADAFIPVLEATLRMNRTINGKRHPQTRKLALSLAKAYIVARNNEQALDVATDYGLEDEVERQQVRWRNPDGQPPEPR